MFSKKPLSFANWKTLVRETFSAFPQLWWRISAVNVLALLVLLLGTGICVVIGMTMFPNFLQNFILNVSTGGNWMQFWPVLVLFVVWTVFVLIFAINSKASAFLTVRNYVHKKSQNPFRIYFVSVWQYFTRYVSIALRSIWYIGWPIVIVGASVFAVERFILVSKWIEIAGLVGIVLVAIWRAVHVAVVRETLIHFDHSAEKAFSTAIAFVRGSWWRVLFSIVTFFFLINLPRALFLGPQEIFKTMPERGVQVLSVLDFLFSFFVLAPLLISFIYFLMLHLSKSKKLKL